LWLHMDKSPPFPPISGVNVPRVGLVHDAEVADDLLAPGGEMAALRTIAIESGVEHLMRKTVGVHAGEVAQPS
jgi:hypothetical protein